MKKRIFSGIQPSGKLHIGNYLGAIQNWVSLQDEYDSIFCIVDLHAITAHQNPEELKKNTLEIAKIYLAAGLDPEKCSIFIQSHVSEHAELAWILNTITKNGDLTKMTQFKDKANFDFEHMKLPTDLKDKSSEEIISESFTEYKKRINNMPMGLFDYPVLMAADILLYDTETVPVGEDQVQHIELTRTLAKRFNSQFGETFKLPEPKIRKESSRIMGLDNPEKKMSKSAQSEYNYIALSDDKETVERKIKKAITDSGNEIVYSQNKPALYNLINIYSSFSGDTPQELEKMYQGKGYAQFKDDLAKIIIDFLEPFQAKMKDLTDEKVLEILKSGAEKVRPLAQKKLQEVKEKMGFIL